MLTNILIGICILLLIVNIIINKRNNNINAINNLFDKNESTLNNFQQNQTNLILQIQKNQQDSIKASENYIAEQTQKMIKFQNEQTRENVAFQSTQQKELHETLNKNLTNLQEIFSEKLEKIKISQSKQTESMLRDNASQQEKLGELVSGNLKEVRETTEQKLDKMAELISLNLKEVQKTTEQKLSQIQGVVDEKLDKTLNDRLDSSFKQISTQLQDLYKTLGELNSLSNGVADLNKTLSNVKTRGTWGEVQLLGILEQTMTPQQYDTNVITKKNSNDRVEFAIKIPSKDDNSFIYLPIDSKMPSDIYNKIVDASAISDTKVLTAACKELENRIKTEARTIRDKYIDPPNTTDFAIMFLPTEGLYAEVLRIDGLAEWCQQNKIIVSGPTTITALLNSLRIGFSNLTLTKKSQEVLKLLQAIKTQYSTFNELIEKTQKKLQEAVSSTDKLKERTEMIQRKMSKVEQLDVGESNKLLELND